MRSIRTFAPTAAMLALIIILAACTQVADDPSPSAPADPTPSSPTSEAPAPTGTPAPSKTPAPSEDAVVEHELPMIGRSTDDGVEVRERPSADAPILTGESFTDPGEMPQIVLDAGDLVMVTLGPLVADGESWYEVAAVDGGDVNFAFGWVPGRFLERESDTPSGYPVIVGLHGQGDGGTTSVDVTGGSPVSVRFAATPMTDADACEIAVTVVNTDGQRVNVETEPVTDVTVTELTPQELPSLFQGEAGTVGLEVETDCAFTAALITPAS